MSKDSKSKISNIKPHKKKSGIMIGTIAVLILTIISFIIAPAFSNTDSGNGKLVFGSYGNSDIEYVPGNYFARQIEYINNIYRDSDTLSDNLEYKRQLVWQTAFNQAVIQIAMEEEILNSGITITKSQIDKAMVERGPFQVDGIFNEEVYRKTSNTVKFDLRKRFREELLKETYISDVIYGANRSNNLVDFIVNIGSDEKKFNYAIFSPENIDPSFYKIYANANPGNFSKISLNRITILSSEEDTASLLVKINNNEISFSDAAIAESKDSFADDGGKSEPLYFHELLKDLESEETANIVFNLKKDEISEIITTSYGWVIFQLTETPAFPDLSSEETLNDIKIYMSRNEKGLIEDHLVSRGNSFKESISETNFASAALLLNIENGITDYFSINFGNNRMIPGSISSATQQNPAFSSAAFDELFLERLFTLDTLDESSEPLVLGNNIIVAQLSGTQKSDKIPEESMEYYKYQVESEISGYMQSDLQNLVLDSPLFRNDFNKTYSKIFYASSGS